MQVFRALGTPPLDPQNRPPSHYEFLATRLLYNNLKCVNSSCEINLNQLINAVPAQRYHFIRETVS